MNLMTMMSGKKKASTIITATKHKTEIILHSTATESEAKLLSIIILKELTSTLMKIISLMVD